MKKILYLGAVVSILSLSALFQPKEAEAMMWQTMECKVEVFNCPTYNKTRQICHQYGNGVPCECGTSSECQTNSQE